MVGGTQVDTSAVTIKCGEHYQRSMDMLFREHKGKTTKSSSWIKGSFPDDWIIGLNMKNEWAFAR